MEHAEDGELNRLLEAARRADLPSPARLARVRERVLSPTPPAARSGGQLRIKLAVGVAVAVLGATFAWRYAASSK